MRSHSLPKKQCLKPLPRFFTHLPTEKKGKKVLKAKRNQHHSCKEKNNKVGLKIDAENPDITICYLSPTKEGISFLKNHLSNFLTKYFKS